MQALPYLMSVTSPTLRRWLMDIVPFPSLHRARDIVDVLHESTKNILLRKREGIEREDMAMFRNIHGRGDDLLGLLCEYLC